MTRLIDIAATAGASKARQAGELTHPAGAKAGGVPPKDDGAFRESLKASVEADAGKAVPAQAGVPAESAAVKAAVPEVVAQTGVPVKVQAPVQGSVEAPVRAAGQAAPSDLGVKVVASEKLAGLVKAAESKTAKSDGLSSAKKALVPGVEPQSGVLNVVQEGSGAAVVSVAAPVPVAAAKIESTQQEAVAPIAGAESFKAVKVGGTNVPAKNPERGGKKLDGGAVAGLKQDVGVNAGAPAPIAVVPAKEGAAVAVAAQAGVAVAPIISGGMVSAHHGEVSGVMASKPAGGGDVVHQAGPQAAEVKTLAASSNVLEVGIESGTHGWLRVRAELGQTGEVTASMVAASAGQADTLRRELPAISTYLAGESVGVSSLVVNATGAAAGAQDAAMSLGAGTQGGGDGRAAQGGSVNEQAGRQAGNASGSGDGGVELEFGGGKLPAAVYANGSGNWLSVRV